jgi:prophage maintenance system killer protein
LAVAEPSVDHRHARGSAHRDQGSSTPRSPNRSNAPPTVRPPDLAALAATYAHGIARLHPFIDGNKRTSLVAAETFIELHGHQLDASDADCVQIWLQVASGDMDETALAAWIRTRLRPVDA